MLFNVLIFSCIGLFHKKKCPKGKNCNFLHVFKNPRNEFWEADRDYDVQRSQRSWSVRSRRSRSRSPLVRRHRSRSPRSRRWRSRSRCRSRRLRRKRSRSRSLRRSEHVGRSKTRRNYHERSRSRSCSPNDREKHSRSKLQLPLRRGSKCRSRSRSNSTSPKSGTFTNSPKKIHHTSDKFTQKKPVSFTIRTRDSSNESKVKVESLMLWQNSEPDC